MWFPPGQILIDVSIYQGNIGWQDLTRWRSDDGRGVVGVIARCANGESIDKKFSENRSGAKGSGLLFGAYGVIYTGKNVEAQARAYVNAVGKLDENDLPPVLDWEVHGGSTAVADAERWIKIVEDSLERYVTVYTYPSFAREVRIPSTSIIAKRDLWIAHYVKAAGPSIPQPWSNAVMWQFAADKSGGLPGINADVDKDTFNADIDGDGNPGTINDLRMYIAKSMIPRVNQLQQNADGNVPGLVDALMCYNKE